MILKKPTFILVILSLVLTLVLAVPQSALANPPLPECPGGTAFIAKYDWDDQLGWVWSSDAGWDVITVTGDAQSGHWDSGSILIEAVYIKDGHTPDGTVIAWLYGPWSPGHTSGDYFASDMIPAQDPPHDISHITFCGNTFPVTMSSFNARANRGTVTIDWVTATEINTAGFLLYRSTTANGSQVQLTENLIAAQGSEVTGSSYRVTDTPGYGTFYYWLRDVDYSGQSSLYGPVVVTVLPAVRLPVYRPNLPGQ